MQIDLSIKAMDIYFVKGRGSQKLRIVNVRLRPIALEGIQSHAFFGRFMNCYYFQKYLFVYIGEPSNLFFPRIRVWLEPVRPVYRFGYIQIFSSFPVVSKVSGGAETSPEFSVLFSRESVFKFLGCAFRRFGVG